MEVAGGGQLVSTKHSGGNISRGLLWSWKAAWDSFHGEELFLGRKIAAPCLSSLLQPRFSHLERRLLVRDWLFHPLNVPLHVNYLLQWEVLIERETAQLLQNLSFPQLRAVLPSQLYKVFWLNFFSSKSVGNIQEEQVFWRTGKNLALSIEAKIQLLKSFELIFKFQQA